MPKKHLKKNLKKTHIQNTDSKKLRKTGIDILGDYPWGTHFCQFYHSQNDLIDMLVPYFKAGLENNEFCMWVTSEPLGVEDAKTAMQKAVPNFDKYLRKKQIEIVPYTEWYVKDNTFNLQRVLNSWIEKLNHALAKGYDGMRITGNTFWLEKRDWKRFVDYEEEINNVISKFRMMAICTYSLAKCTAFEVMDVVKNHQFAIIKRDGKWETIESFEHKKAEELWRESDRKFQTLAENTPGVVCIYDIYPDGHRQLIYLGPGMEELFGKTTTDKIGNSIDCFFKLIHPEDLVTLQKAADEAEKTGKIFDHEYRVCVGPEDYVWVRSINRMKRRESGIVRWSGQLVDINKRKIAEDEIKKSEKKFRMLFEGANDVIIYVDKRGKILEVNKLVEDIFGYKVEDIKGKNVFRLGFIVKKDLPLILKLFNDVVRKGKIKDVGGKGINRMELQLRHKNGSKVFVESNSKAIKENGKLAGFLSIIRDITERKQVEEALRKSEVKFRNVVDNIGLGISLISPNMEILTLNKQMREWFPHIDVSQKPICYKVYKDPPVNKICSYCSTIKTLKDGEIHRAISETPSKGGIKNFQTISTPLKDENGKVIAAIELIEDITERKRAEDEIKQKTDDLRLINSLNDAVNRGANFQEIINLLCKETKRIFSCDGAAVYLLSENKKHLVLQKHRNLEKRIKQICEIFGIRIPGIIKIPLREGSLYWNVLKSGKPQLINDPSTIKNLVLEFTEDKILQKLIPKIYRILDIGSVLNIPLVSDGEVVGMMDVSRNKSFTESELQRFKIISEQLTSIIGHLKAEEKIQQHNEFLNNVIESLTHPFFVIDVNDYTIKMTNSAARGSGISENQTCYYITHRRSKPCSEEKHICPLKEIKKTKKPVIVEHIHFDKDGNRRNIEVHGYPILDTVGNVIQMIEYSLDITERKRAEETLQKSESKYRTLLENLSQKIFLKDKNSVYLSCNENYARDLKIKPEEIVGKTDYDFYPKKLAEKYRADDKRLMELGKTETIDEKYIQDGQEVIVQTVKTPVRDERDKVIGILGIFWDITEQRKAEEALRESDERFRMALRNTSITIFSQDKNLRFTWAYNMSPGFDVNAIIGKTDADLVTPEDAKKPMAIKRQVLQTGQGARAEASYFKDGEKQFYDLMVEPMVDTTGEIVGVICLSIDITERKQAEEKLHYQANLLENVSDAIISTDLDFNIRTWNIAAETMYGWHVYEVMGKSMQEITKLEFPYDKEPDVLKKILKKGHWKSEIIQKHREGTIINVLASFSLLKDDSGNPMGVVMVNYDITERKRAEEALRESEEKYRTLTRNINVGIYRNTVGPRGKFIEANPAIIKMFGYKTRDEFLLIDVADLYQNRKDRQNFNKKMLRNGFVKNEELKLKRKDGTLFYGSDSAVAVKDENGEVKYYDGIIEDITERKKVEEALRESEERFSLFMDYFPECAFIKDQETRTLFVNKYMNDIFGAKEWLGKTVFELFPSDVAEKMMADDRITLDSGYRTAIEEIPDKNGVIHIYETYKFKLNRQNKPPLLGGIALDITERKHAEEQIKKSLKEKEVLLKEIHHRVKNNMQIISSLLNLQSRYIKGKKALEMFKNSQARIRAMALVHEKLYRSKDLARINFVEYVQDLVRQLFRSHGISPMMISYNIRIKDVFLNINKAIPCSLIINELVSNSLKHAFPEGEKGKIDIDFYLGKDNKLLLKIRDNGIGLLDKIDFKNTKTLGLQLVTTLVEQLNGTIEVDIKRGTTFKIRFDKSEGK